MQNKIYVEQINDHDEQAWHSLYDKFYAPLCNYALNYVSERSDAEDVVQDTMVKIWNSDVRFNSYAHLSYYMYKAVYHNSVERIRMLKNNVEITEEMNDLWGDEDFCVSIREEMHRRLWNAIKDLPPARQSIIMKTMEGKSIKEIADELGISISTVKNAKHHAIETLKKITHDSPLLMLL